ncbi:MAG: HAD family phosphatase [Oscillospiraceae bacterium]|nr:HAD family phosphatase [Oscillospiraceae bacterium]
MNPIKLVCFDLDDTLIIGVHSVMFPCILNGKEKEHAVIQQREDEGALDYIEADYLRAKLLRGLPERLIEEKFAEYITPLAHVTTVMDVLKSKGIRTLIITVGPEQVARIAQKRWGMDTAFGSEYKTADGIFTGEIVSHLGTVGKQTVLQKYYEEHGIKREECAAVGDGSTDIPLFEYCGRSVALNGSAAVAEKATYTVKTDDLMDILPYIT